jgi:hypothetical protein
MGESEAASPPEVAEALAADAGRPEPACRAVLEAFLVQACKPERDRAKRR